MKRMFDSIEMSVIVVGVVIIIGIVVVSMLKEGIEQKETYVSNIQEETAVSSEEVDTLSLKQEVFTVEQNGLLSEEISTYFNGNESLYESVTLDLSQVDMEAVGTYEASGTTEDETFTFEIEVEESENPSFTYAYQEFKYLVGAYSSIEEVKEIANVHAYDKEGNDITESIEGWPEELPTTYEETTYTLTAEDSEGNIGYVRITVEYQEVIN